MTLGLGSTGNQSQDEGERKQTLHRVSHGVRLEYPTQGVNYLWRGTPRPKNPGRFFEL
jgi:hypothetical protein